MLRYFLAATAIVVGIMLVFLAFPLRLPRPVVQQSANTPGPRATLPIFPHSTGGAITGKAPWAFDALPSCFRPRWEWQPGSDRIEERVTRAVVAARAAGNVHATMALDAWTGTPLAPKRAAAALHGDRLSPLPSGWKQRAGDCSVTIEGDVVHIVRGEDNLTVPAARAYVLSIDAQRRLLIVAHDAPASAEVGGYLLLSAVGVTAPTPR